MSKMVCVCVRNYGTGVDDNSDEPIKNKEQLHKLTEFRSLIPAYGGFERLFPILVVFFRKKKEAHLYVI